MLTLLVPADEPPKASTTVSSNSPCAACDGSFLRSAMHRLASAKRAWSVKDSPDPAPRAGDSSIALNSSKGKHEYALHSMV